MVIKMNRVKRISMTAAAVLIIAANTAGVFAATPVPSKAGNTTTDQTTQTTTQTDKTTATSTAQATAKATSKATATAKATSKATAKATATAKTSSTSTAKATSKPKATTGTDEEDPEATVEVTVEPTEQVTSNNEPLVFSEEADKGVLGTEEDTAANSNRYTTKGGSFGWFVLSLIVNAIISFIIGNRFYKMGRKDTHVLAEIRALKRDIDAKMQNNIGGFSEYETVIENSNKNFGDEEKSANTIAAQSAPEKTEDEIKAEEMANEIYRKWESQVLAAKEREAARSNANGNRPNRTRTSPKKNQNGFSDKVKDFINDVFPFDKD